jgi:hypothetical protein
MDAREKPASETYTEGVQARANDLPGEANPYPAGSAECAAWDKGWMSLDAPADDPAVEAPTG